MHTAARILVNLAGILAILVVAGGFAWMERDRDQQDENALRAIQEVQRFGQMLDLRAATRDVALNDQGWPTTIEPAWFKGEPPVNHLLSLDRPWVDMATAEEESYSDPLIRVATNKDHASFWYNPSLGIIRARVPMGINDEETLRVYNRVNATSLASLFGASEAGVKTASKDAIAKGQGRAPAAGPVLKVSEGENEEDRTGLAGINPMALPGVPLGADTSGKNKTQPKAGQKPGKPKPRSDPSKPRIAISPSEKR